MGLFKKMFKNSSTALTALVLLFFTVVSIMTEKMMFGCTSKEGKKIHIKGVPNKSILNLFGSYFILAGGIPILLLGLNLMGLDLPPLGIGQNGFLFLCVLGLLSILVGAWLIGFDTSFSKGYMVFNNKSKNNWNFIRIVGMINTIVIILLNMQFASSICGTTSLYERAGQGIQTSTTKLRSMSPRRNQDNDIYSNFVWPWSI